jgi:hypothetical protein
MISSVPSIIDYIIEAEAHGKTIQNKPSVILYVSSDKPLEFEDSAKNKLTVNKTNLETYVNNYKQIKAESSIRLEDCEVLLNYGKNKEITGCDIHSKSVTLDVETEKTTKVKNFEIRLTLNAVNGLIPVLPSTRRYLRRMEKAEFFKKNASKKATTDIVSFIQPAKADKKQTKKIENFTVLPVNVETLDSNSVQILKDLLPFVNK